MALETTNNRKIKVVLIGGLAQSGKTTLANLLQSHASVEGWMCQHLAFADPLKSIVRMVQQQYEGKDGNALQATSDQWKMHYGQNCFARDLTARVIAHVDGVPDFLNKILITVPDLRYLREIKAAQEFLGKYQVIFVRVVRPGFEQFDRDMTHPSETELLDVQYENYRIEAADMDALVLDAAELWKLIRV